MTLFWFKWGVGKLNLSPNCYKHCTSLGQSTEDTNQLFFTELNFPWEGIGEKWKEDLCIWKKEWEEGCGIGIRENTGEFAGGDVLMLDESDRKE